MPPTLEHGRITRRTVRLLALMCVALAAMCVALAAAWSRKADEAACYRQALEDGETPAVADTDCGGAAPFGPRMTALPGR